MKINALLLVLVLWTSCTDAPKSYDEKENFPVDFTQWHTGNFYYQEYGLGTFLIHRTDSIQEEFVKANGMIVAFDISWKNDSVYTLQFAGITENPANKEVAKGVDSLIKQCTITDVRKNRYLERAISNLSGDTLYTPIRRHVQPTH